MTIPLGVVGELPDRPGPCLGRGRTAEIFAWGAREVLKLFRPDAPAFAIQRELEIARVVAAAGLPVPGVSGLVRLDDRQGIVYERIFGPSMLETLLREPWKLGAMARIMAELQAAIHRLTLPGLPLQRERRLDLSRRIHSTTRLSPKAGQAVQRVLAGLPDGRAVCHGDFHPDNILMAAGGPVIIDWANAVLGNPLADAARTVILLRYGTVPPGLPGRRLLHTLRRYLCRQYLRQYLKLRSADLREIQAWLAPVAAARLMDEGIPGERSRLAGVIDRAFHRLGTGD